MNQRVSYLESLTKPMRYVAVRIVQGAFLLVVVSLLCFVFLEAAPGDFFQERRLNPQISPETLSRLRSEYGLDQSFAVRYTRWLESTLHGDLGYSFAYGTAVAPLLLARVRNTLFLTGTATIVAWAIALSLAMMSAVRPGGVMDRFLSLASSALLSIPELLLALGLLAIGVRSGWFPAGGMVSAGFEDFTHVEQARDLLRHLALPVIALVLGSLPTLARHVRATLLEVLDSPYIWAALGNGISRSRILVHHALPAAINPLVSLFGLSVAALLSGSLLTEVIMSWPGLGPLLVEAVLAKDVYVVIGAVMFSTVFLLCGAALADLLLFAADPRIRAEAIR